MAVKRLAITVSGAVSLGSYEAGVLYEVLRAIGEHNVNPDTLANPDQRIEIDVLTGASAGGMSAAIMAQVLHSGADRLASASDNAFYLPWVKQVNLAGLLAGTVQSDPPNLSLLASSFVEKIAEANIVDYPAGPRHAAAPANAGTIRLGLAMSNLNGIDYTLPTHGAEGPEAFTYTRFQDEFLWRLDQPDREVWQAVRAAALGCGAFPLAFRARALVREASDYPGAAPENFPQDARALTYVDGGVFQNEPLGLAKALVDEIDDDGDNDRRFYLFVAPGAKTGVAATSTDTNAASETLLKTSKDLAKAVFWQARFQDWIAAQKTNARIELFNRRAAALAALLQANPGLVAALAGPVEALLHALYHAEAPAALLQAPAAAAEDGGAPWGDEIERLRIQFQTLPDVDGTPRNLLAGFGPGPGGDVWLKAILVFEKAADLGDKDEMAIYTITAEDNELAGDPLFAFAGFIDEKIRQHDYDLGRVKARLWLRRAEGALFPIRASLTEPLAQPDPALAGWTMRDFDQGLRQQLRDRLSDRLDLLLQEAGLNWITRKGIETFFLDGKIDGLLGL